MTELTFNRVCLKLYGFNQTTSICDVMDIDCVARRLLTCVAYEEQVKLSAAQHKNLANSTVAFYFENKNVGNDKDMNVADLPNNQNGDHVKDTSDNNSTETKEHLSRESEQKIEEMAKKLLRLEQESEVKFLSFALCMTKALQSGIVQVKGNAFLAAKWVSILGVLVIKYVTLCIVQVRCILKLFKN